MNATNKTVIASVVMLVLGLGGGWSLSQWRTGTAHGDPAAAARADAPASAATGVATAGSAERKVLYWYDPMVPTQKFDKPGKSPFMDMQLVPRYADEADAGSKPGVSVSAHAQQSLGLRVAVADTRVLAASVDAVGTVLLNERDISIVQSRASGFVERVYARAPGDVIAAGAPIVDLLVPEWLAAQQEFLAVRATGDAALTEAARQRLVLLGMPAALIDQVAASGKAQAIQTLTAPNGGLIAELMVRQGMTVGMGMTLARINGLGTVWVEAAVPEALAATVAPGQSAEVRLPAAPGQVIQGKVTAVLPEANRDTRTLRVRVELPNPGLRLRSGMFAQIALQGAPQRDAVTVPAESVVRTGRRAIVYLLDAPGRYRPVEVELGPEIGDRIVVRKGIDAGQQVVASGQFLIDSEATLQGVTARAATAASEAAPATAKEYEVRGVVSEPAEGGVITLDHEPVPALKWPAMTMPFPLARPDLAKGLKPGDKVRFTFRQQGDESVITAIEKAKP
jgi:Cu(I)/Ag(I) efflux system membrane fusion protein